MDTNWQRLGPLIKRRRQALGLTQEVAAARSEGQVSSATWRKLEKGDTTSYNSASLVGVCRVLEWTLDSIDNVIAGGEPTLAGASTPSRPVGDDAVLAQANGDELMDLLNDLQARQRAVIEELARRGRGR